MKLRFDGKEVRAITLEKAKVQHVIRLQEETGMSMAEISKAANKADVLNVVLMGYLTRWNMGLEPSFTDMLENWTLEEIGEPVVEPGDKKRAAEAEGKQSEDPQQSETPADDETTG